MGLVLFVLGGECVVFYLIDFSSLLTVMWLLWWLVFLVCFFKIKFQSMFTCHQSNIGGRDEDVV